MQETVGVRFEGTGKIYHFAPAGLQLKAGDSVIVETTHGQALARVVIAPHQSEEGERELKSVLCRATVHDLLLNGYYKSKEGRALEKCQEKVTEHGLSMKPIKAKYSFDGKQLTIYFTAEERVDYRRLARELSRSLKTRTEFRQLGPRDEAKMLGGIGNCGRPLCCTTFLTEFTPIHIKMAKRQNLPLSPESISGQCGRLCCCLSYEDEYYRAIEQQLPKVGSEIDTPYGPGKVVSVNTIKQSINVELQSKTIVEIPIKCLNADHQVQAALNS